MLGRSTHCSRSSGAPSCCERRAHRRARFRSSCCRLRRMRREDDRVLALDRVDGDADRRDVGARDRNQRGDDAGRLRVLDDALVRQLLDDAHALLPQRVAQDAEHLGAAARLADCPCRSRRRSSRASRVAVASLPPAHADGAAQPIDRRLIVGLDRAASRRARGRRSVCATACSFGRDRSCRCCGDCHRHCPFWRGGTPSYVDRDLDAHRLLARVLLGDFGASARRRARR